MTTTTKLPEIPEQCQAELAQLQTEITELRQSVDAAWVQVISSQHAGDKTGEAEGRERLARAAPALEAAKAREAALQDRLAILNRAKREVAQADHERQFQVMEAQRPEFMEWVEAENKALTEATIAWLRAIHRWLVMERKVRDFKGKYDSHASNSHNGHTPLPMRQELAHWELHPLAPKQQNQIYPVQIRHIWDAVHEPNFDRLARLAAQMHYEKDFSKPITQEKRK